MHQLYLLAKLTDIKHVTRLQELSVVIVYDISSGNIVNAETCHSDEIRKNE